MPITDSNLTFQNLVEIFTEAGCESTDKAGLLAFNEKLTAEQSEDNPLKRFVGALTKTKDGEEMEELTLFDRLLTMKVFWESAEQPVVCNVAVTIVRNQLSSVLDSISTEHLLDIAYLAIGDCGYSVKMMALLSYLRKREIPADTIIKSTLLERYVQCYPDQGHLLAIVRMSQYIEECKDFAGILDNFRISDLCTSAYRNSQKPYEFGPEFAECVKQHCQDIIPHIGLIFALQIDRLYPSLINIAQVLQATIQTSRDLHCVIEFLFNQYWNPVDSEGMREELTMVCNAIGTEKLNDLMVLRETFCNSSLKILWSCTSMLLPESLLDMFEARGDTLADMMLILFWASYPSQEELLSRWKTKLPTLITNPEDLKGFLNYGLMGHPTTSVSDKKRLRNRVLLLIKGHIAQFDSEEMHRVFSSDNDYSQDVFNVFKETQWYTLGLSFYEKRYAESNTGTLAQKLNQYIAVRTKEEGSFHWDFLWIKTFVYWLTGQEYKSKDSKISAANALLTSLDNNGMNDHQLLLGVDVIHHKALTDGLLGEIVQGHVEHQKMAGRLNPF